MLRNGPIEPTPMEREEHDQSRETGDLGDSGRWTVRGHPRTDAERPILWERVG